MSILSNTVSICQFEVAGKLPWGDLFEWAAGRLARNSFQPIDETAEESSSGWVRVDDPNENGFDVPAAFCRDHPRIGPKRKWPSVDRWRAICHEGRNVSYGFEK